MKAPLAFLLLIVVATATSPQTTYRHNIIITEETFNDQPTATLRQLSSPLAAQQLNSPGFWSPELHRIYNFTRTTHRPNIAIVEPCHSEAPCGFYKSDIETYWDRLNNVTWPHLGVGKTERRPRIFEVFVYDQVNKVSGANTPGFSDADAEVVLDIEILTGLFPGFEVDVTVYFTPNSFQGIYNGFKWAIDSKKHSVISFSWGLQEYWTAPSPFDNFIQGEGGKEVSYFDGTRELMRRASLEGISVFVSSGDDGASAGLATPYNVLFPASSPYVISCGGTTLELTNGSYGSPMEVVWNDAYGATGGGYSQYFKPTSFQKEALKNTENKGNSYRGIPDVAALSSPTTGHIIYWTRAGRPGRYYFVGGTSAASPLWAGLWATVTDGRRVYAGDVIYSRCAVDGFTDITEGDNGDGVDGFFASEGYDLCTGMGTPRGGMLRRAIRRLERTGSLCGRRVEGRRGRGRDWREERLEELISEWRESH